MTLPYAELKAQFRDLADDLVHEVNATMVALYFLPTTTASTSVNMNSLSYDVFGNPTPYDQIGPLQSGQQQMVEPVIQSITGRVYWNPKDLEPQLRKELAGKDLRSVCKLNCFAADIERLRAAGYAIINDQRCVRIKDPIPYGLMGEKFYCQSFWEVML